MSIFHLAGEPATPGAVACLVCGNEIAPGEGVTTLYRDQVIRLKCPGCASRFLADPERYLGGGPTSCCGGDAHAADGQGHCAGH